MYLYRYQKIDPDKINRIEDIILKNRLYFSHPTDFNDPFDCKIVFDPKSENKTARKKLKKLIKEKQPDISNKELNNTLNDIFRNKKLENAIININRLNSQNIGVLCLTERKDNILMWSHYGDCHKGLCFEFFHNKKDPLIGTAQKVIYSDRCPYYKYGEVDTEEVILDYLFTKSKSWEYEQEWRIVTLPYGPNSGPGLHNYNPYLLTGVIFGCRIDDDTRKGVIDIVSRSSKNITLYQAKESIGTYSLTIAPFTS